MNTTTEFKNWSSQQCPKLLVTLMLTVALQSVYAAPGDVDLSFDPGTGPNWDVESLAVQADGKILIGGKFTSINTMPGNCIARLNADGSLDGSFLLSTFHGTVGGGPAVESISLQDDGKAVIGGGFTAINGVPRGCLARINTDGSLDGSFLDGQGGASWDVTCLTIQPDSKILIGGCFYSVNGVGQRGIARLNLDGSQDTAFSGTIGTNDWDGYLCSLALQSDGKIMIGGWFSSVDGIARKGIARLDQNGALDGTFQTTLTAPYLDSWPGVAEWSPISCIVLQRDNKILIGGLFNSVNNVARTNLARLNPDGSLDTSFLSGLSGPLGPVNALAVQSDGKILIGGMFGPVNGTMRQGIARLNPNGSLDMTFAPNLGKPFNSGGRVLSFALQADGKILTGGDFADVNQVPRSNVARLSGEPYSLDITVPPNSQTVERGDAAWLEVEVTGFPAPCYQWFFNGTNEMGCTNAWLEFTNLQISAAGCYTVVINNGAGITTNVPAYLQVIPRVERRPVPGIKVMGEIGSSLNVEHTESLSPTSNWLPLDTISLTNPPQYWFDLTGSLPPQRFYRAWQVGTPSVVPSLNFNFVPTITLTGNIGDKLRLDCINQVGPTDAWVTLDTVTLTNTSQLYFDTSAVGQPTRLYRIVPVP